MSCCGKHLARQASGKADYPRGDEHFKAPTEPCVCCAEKHLSTAYALAMEVGYETPNRQRIAGELVACQWHLYKHNSPLAAQVRAARHLIQWRKESQVDWLPLLKGVDALVNAEIASYQT